MRSFKAGGSIHLIKLRIVQTGNNVRISNTCRRIGGCTERRYNVYARTEEFMYSCVAYVREGAHAISQGCAQSKVALASETKE